MTTTTETINCLRKGCDDEGAVGGLCPAHHEQWEDGTLATDQLGRPSHAVYQIDAWPNRDHWDFIVSPDEDGDALTGSPDTTYESHCMGIGVAVRAHILKDTDPATAARLLRKMADWVDRGVLYHVNNPFD